LYTQDHYQLLADHHINNQLTLNTAVFLTKGQGYYEQYKAEQKFSKYGLANPIINGAPVTKTDLIRRLWLDNDFYGQTFGVHYNRSNTTIILGGAWSQYKGKHFGEVIWAQYAIPQNHRWYNLNAVKNDMNSFAKWRQQLPGGWNVFGDLQYRNVFYNINGFRNNPQVVIRQQYHFINPKTGITYEGKKVQVALSYALANKEPNREDFEAGKNELPKHETLHDAELNIHLNVGKATGIQFTAYHMYYRNQLVLTGKINDVGAYTRQNTPVSYRTGVEIQAAGKLNKWCSLTGNLALSNNKIKDFTEYMDDYDNGGQKTNVYHNRNISFSPATIASLTAGFTPFKGFSADLVHKYVGKQYLDNTQNEQRKLNSYLVADALFSYQPVMKFLPGCRLLFQVNNMFDKQYEPNGYTFSYFYGAQTTTENYYYPMAGRNFMVGVNVKL
jgi:iron complex outermembrane receptor protein